MSGEHSEAGSVVAFRRTADLREARTKRESFVAYLRERVGRRLRAVVERGPNRRTVAFLRGDLDAGDFDLEQGDGFDSDDDSLSDGVRTNHRCTVAVRESTVWLSLDHRDGRVLVAVESRPSRDLARFVADCRAALSASGGTSG